MADVARRAGVAAITVSRALSDSAQVSTATLARIRRAIAETGYVRHALAGSLASNATRCIGAVVPVLSNSIFADTLQGLSEVLEEQSYRLLIASSQYDLLREQHIVEAFIGQRVDGIALTGTTHTASTRGMLTRSRIPVVQMWNLPTRPFDCAVGFSNSAAARAMVRYLISRGYRRIAYIGGLTHKNDRTQARERGYRNGLVEAGLEVKDALIRRTPFEFENGASALSDLVQADSSIDAVFAASDVLAVGALLHCLRRGWPVPKKVALAGLDGSPIGALITPELTSMRFPRRQIGVRAAELLLDRIRGRPAGVVEDLGFELLTGGSA